MASPSSRRPGFSRKAQYGLFLGYVIAVAGILFAVLLLVIAVIDPRGFAALKGAALDATTPVSSAGRSVVGFFTGIGDNVGNYFNAASQNAELRTELAQTKRELIAAQAATYENRRLRQLLGLAAEADNEVTVARIVGSTLSSPRRLGTLSAGSSAGVEVGQPVRGPDGLIGRVIEAGRWAARVLLITDGNSSVPVRLVRDGTPALAAGRGDGMIELRTLEVGTNPFRVGDVMVTSGVGGIFPPNIPVARVVAIRGDATLAVPAENPGRADYALVQRAYLPASQGALDAADPQDAARPVSVPPQAAPATPPARQDDPSYQPALQQPPPGVSNRPLPQPAAPRPR